MQYVLAEELMVEDGLRLRVPNAADAHALSKVVADSLDSLRPWLPHLVPLVDVTAMSQFMAAKREQWARGRAVEWAIARDESILGCAWLSDVQYENEAADLGYWLSESARGSGIATRCASRVLEYAFDDLGLHRVSTRCIASNLASRGVPQRLGLVEEATIREAWKVNGAHVDHVIYRFLAREWRLSVHADRTAPAT